MSLHSNPNVRFDPLHFSFFITNFVDVELLFFILYLLTFFYPRMNKPYMHTYIIGISSSQNELNHPALLEEFFENFVKVWAHFTR